VDTAKAIRQLPDPYRRALELEAQGLDDDAIARRLGLEPEAAAVFLRLARAKLVNLSRRP
jgi:DNA-directed RNA polymerase specialized sigma24 family protein